MKAGSYHPPPVMIRVKKNLFLHNVKEQWNKNTNNCRAILLKPAYETPIETATQIIEDEQVSLNFDGIWPFDTYVIILFWISGIIYQLPNYNYILCKTN